MPRLRAAAVFSDAILGLKVSELHGHLVQRLGPAWVLDCSSWRFDSLLQPEVLAAAAPVAADADLIIVASPSEQELPLTVMAWLRAAMTGRKGHDRALITLLGRPMNAREARSPVRDCLEDMARQAGLAFFPHRVVQSAPVPAALVDHLDERARAVTATLRGILSHPMPGPRWGINE